MEHPLITLLTDFGEDDFFVASLKGAILSINPLVQIVDITHRVPPFAVRRAGFILFSCYRFFPTHTIFLSVVDPGVGSGRRILLVETKKYFFIAPDNGLLTLILDQEQVYQIREVTNPKYFLSKESRTFEARDKMAPVAAWISRSIPTSEFGKSVSKYEKMEIPKPRIRKNTIEGCFLYHDKFGNLITNIPNEMMDLFVKDTGKTKLTLAAGRKEVVDFHRSYSDAKRGELLVIEGSVGLIEVSAREASAFKKLKAKPGDPIKILIQRNIS